MRWNLWLIRYSKKAFKIVSFNLVPKDSLDFITASSSRRPLSMANIDQASKDLIDETILY